MSGEGGEKRPFVCAAWEPGKPKCKTTGPIFCDDCWLVWYCGEACHNRHRAVHVAECIAAQYDPTWSPAWRKEDRAPAFTLPDAPSSFGGRKFLWGNVPAIDVLRLDANEDKHGYEGNLRLLFAASGDPRNIIKTIAHIPWDTDKDRDRTIQVTINDREFHVVARNIIILLIALTMSDFDETIDCIIHVWYSTWLRKSDINILQQRVRPLIAKVCESNKKKRFDAVVTETFTVGRWRMQVILDLASWRRLLTFTTLPEGLTKEQAKQIRDEVMFSPVRQDFRDRSDMLQSPPRRYAMHKFRRDGIMLPFGARREEHTEPNPTFFQNYGKWPMHDNADPLYGWFYQEVEFYCKGGPPADIYGRLFYFLQSLIRSFLYRLNALPFSLKLFNMDARLLRKHVEARSFDRIKVSNIADAGYIGIKSVLRYLAPLLRSPSVNPHATLITLFMNAIREESNKEDEKASQTEELEKRLSWYLRQESSKVATGHRYDVDIIKLVFALAILANYDGIFDRYMEKCGLGKSNPLRDIEPKGRHTIIDKWPFRLKLSPGQEGALEEFDRLLSGGIAGDERYIEWRRIASR